jgi:protein-S-isoprenylcysteine O-methyltransferase Ste14
VFPYVRACVAGMWLVMGLLTVLRRRPGPAREIRRGRGWSLGFLLQTLSFGVVFYWRRPAPHGDVPVAEWVAGVGAIMVAAASTWLIAAAQRALGRQFGYQARLVEGHELITAGPYRLVRHPIYSGLLGLMLATAVVVSRWPAIPLSVALYLAGTFVRTRSEERLLRAAFGAEFDEYARRVPAIIPGLPARRVLRSEPR